MENEQTLSILKALAEGIDPATGERFPADTPWQRADTVRALYRAIAALESPARPARASAQRPGAGNAGKPWSKEEDERLVAGFEAGQTIDALAEAHGRSRLAVEARLARFGRVPMPSGLRIAGTPQAAEAPAARYAVTRPVLAGRARA